MGEVIFHIILIVVMGLFFKESFEINTGRVADPIGPAGFPQFILVVILLLLLISLFNAIRKMKSGEAKISLNLNIAYFGLLFGIVVFIILNDIISFTLASIIFCLFTFFLLGQKKILKMVINSIVVSVVFTLVFGQVLSVPLPRGMGMIKELTYLLY